MHFLDIDEHVAVGALLQLHLQLVDLGALAADDDARTRRADNNAQLVARTLNLHRTHARGLELVAQLFLQLYVFQKQLVVIALNEPARPPRLGVSKAKSVRMDFLSHALTSLLSS